MTNIEHGDGLDKLSDDELRELVQQILKIREQVARLDATMPGPKLSGNYPAAAMALAASEIDNVGAREFAGNLQAQLDAIQSRIEGQ